MIYIVHGEDVVKTRTLLVNQYKKLNSQTKFNFDITETEIQDFETALRSTSLFGEPPIVVLDITGMNRMNVDKFIESAAKTPQSTTLIIVSEKSLSNANAFIKNAARLNAKIICNEKKPEENIFRFVDTLMSKNRTATYTELEKLINAEENEIYILTMIVYGLRNVAITKFESPLFNKIPPFNKSKSVKQAQSFTEEQVIKMYETMYDLDKKVKTGEITTDIVIPMAIETVLNS
jgi:DNA polymerase III delta subunit